MKKVLALLIAANAATALAAPPAPVADVSGFTRTMTISWNTVPQTNGYEIWARANDGASWVKFGEANAARTRAQWPVSTHLLNFEQARYVVKACNPSGCTPSAETGWDVPRQSVYTTAFIKPSRTQTGAKFGSAIDLSEDGHTLVSVSSAETDVSSGRESIPNIYLFNDKYQRYWKQEARIFPSIVQPDSGAGVVANLSGDGNVLVVGVPAQRSKAALDAPEVGGAYLFRRLPDGRWREELKFTAAVSGVIHYGAAAEISEDAKVVMIGYEKDGGTAEIYRLRDDGLYEFVTVIPGPGNQTGCNRLRLSGDGQTVARTCSKPPYYQALQVFRGPAYALDFEDNLYSTGEPLVDLVVDYAGETFAWSSVGCDPGSQQVVGYRQRRNGIITRSQSLTQYWTWHENSIAQSEFGGRLALSRDGGYLAVRDVRDTGAGLGPLAYPLTAGHKSTGAVFIYEWRNDKLGLRRILKPNLAAPRGGYFEGELAFAENGKTFAASQPGETSSATTPYHWGGAEVRPDAGAVIVY